MRKLLDFRVAVLVALLYGGAASAQVATGTISGTVRDASGAALPGTKVVVLNADTGISRTVETDVEGRYSALSLSLGNYKVTASLAGFGTQVRSGIVLTVGREEIVDLSLAVGSVEQSVEVSGEAPLVDSTTATLGSLVDAKTIRAIPLNGRSWDQLALLQPGVILTSPGIPASTSYLFGSGKRFSVGGQRDVSNYFLLDGTDINDQANGTPGGAAGTNLGVDTILEFKIFTNSFKAEYGHSTGSITSAVTRSGTNDWHGTGFEYIRNSVLDTRNYFDTTASPPPFKRNQFGGVLGGPIKKDKTFIFGGYEGLRQGQDTTQIATVPTALARQGVLPTGTVPVNPVAVPYLNLYPLPNGRDFGNGTAEFLSAPTAITNEDNAMVRVDHQLNAKTGLFARYTFDQDSVNQPLNLPDAVQLSATRRQYLTLQATTVLSPKALNSFRFAYNRTDSNFNQLIVPDPGPDLDFIPGQPFGALNVGGSNSTGSNAITGLGNGNANGQFFWAYNVYQWGDDFSYTIGKHTLKAGTDIQNFRDNTQFPSGVRGDYTFSTLNTLLAGTPSSLQAGAPLGVNPNWELRQTLYAVYGQDDYTVNSRLTLNLGLRWEITTDPIDALGKMAILPDPLSASTVTTDSFFQITKKNFEPRFGLAWQMNQSGTTVLRVGAGIYHDQILPWLYANQLQTPPFFGRFNLNNPIFPNGYTQLTGGVGGSTGNGKLSLTVPSPIEKVPVDEQYNLSIEHQFAKDTVLQIAYAGNHANHLLTQREADTPVPTVVNGQYFYPVGSTRRNPAWNGIRLNETDGDSTYNSVTATLRRQLAKGLEGQIFYTFSKAMDDASGTNTSDTTRSPAVLLNPWDRAFDWSLSDFDVRHAAVGNFTYQLPSRVDSKAWGAVANGWALNGIVTVTSGQPFTARLSAAVSRDLDTTLAERPSLNPGFSQNPNHGISAGCPGFAAGTPVGNANNWYDPCAFVLPAAGTYGDVGRNSIIGPGLRDLDLALVKTFNLNERTFLSFRAECFNVLNHANFGLPNSSALAASGEASPSAGRITYTVTSSRQIQFALRLGF
jgi:hypothetical protein